MTEEKDIEIFTLLNNFIASGNAYKDLAKSIRYEDGDRAWIHLEELKRNWMDTAWLLHDRVADDQGELQHHE